MLENPGGLQPWEARNQLGVLAKQTRAVHCSHESGSRKEGWTPAHMEVLPQGSPVPHSPETAPPG